jgi:hypothetical protein
MKSFKIYMSLLLLGSFGSFASLEAGSKARDIFNNPSNTLVRGENLRLADGTGLVVIHLKTVHDLELVGIVAVSAGATRVSEYVSTSCRSAAFEVEKSKNIVRIFCEDLTIRGGMSFLHTIEVPVGPDAGGDGSLIGQQKVLTSNRAVPIF